MPRRLLQGVRSRDNPLRTKAAFTTPRPVDCKHFKLGPAGGRSDVSPMAEGAGMARRRVYLDWNATAPLLPAARAAMLQALDVLGNPSSVHQEGRAARALVEQARADVAALVGVSPAGVTFTSGGTEAANLALTPTFRGRGGGLVDVLIVGAGEHACVRDGARFPPGAVEAAPLGADGVVDLAALESLLARHSGRRVMLALQAANNETGVIQPVREASALVHAHGGVVVCDAVQAAGRIPCDVAALGADAVILSGHKMGAPKGVGALVLCDPDANIEDMQIRGGGQERGVRAGTENVAGIAAFGAAARWAVAYGAAEAESIRPVRDAMEQELVAARPDLTLFGAGAPRLPNTSAFALAGAPAETALIGLDLEGFAVSSGSACSSGKVRPSQVLEAMGVGPELARGAIRVSLGRDTRREEALAFVQAWARVCERIELRRKSAA